MFPPCGDGDGGGAAGTGGSTGSAGSGGSSGDAGSGGTTGDGGRGGTTGDAGTGGGQAGGRGGNTAGRGGTGGGNAGRGGTGGGNAAAVVGRAAATPGVVGRRRQRRPWWDRRRHAGRGGGGGRGGTGGGAAGGTGGAATFAQVATILGNSCGTGTCHDGQEHVDLRNNAGLYNRIVNASPDGSRTMAACTSRTLIEPGDVAMSVIAQTIMASVSGCTNARMPDECPSMRPCLTAAQIATITSWITAGAPM